MEQLIQNGVGSSSLEWRINRVDGGGPLLVHLQNGIPTFIVGANGSGKSALLQKFVSENPQQTIRIPAHRQTSLLSGSREMTATQRRNFATNIAPYEVQDKSRCIEYASEQRHKATLYDLISLLQTCEHEVYESVTDKENEESPEKKISWALSQRKPIDELNEVFMRGAIPITLKFDGNDTITAHHNESNQSYSIAELSDGERNAVLLASIIITAPENFIILIDEPERHLHPAISKPLLTSLFDLRKDCKYIISTHEIVLPMAYSESQVLMVRTCTWEEGKPKAWDITLHTENSQLPDDLKRLILGSRKCILFVEGEEEGLDYSLYQLLFPAVSIEPLGGCHEVIRSVSGLRDIYETHYVDAFGLVDNDDRDQENISMLAKKNIYALDVHSIESLYFNSVSVAAVAKQLKTIYDYEVEKTISEAKSKAIDEFKIQAENMASRRTERLLRDRILSKIPKWKKIKDQSVEFVCENVTSLYQSELDRINQLVQAQAFDALVARYPIGKSNIPNQIAKTLGFRNLKDYENALLKIVRNDNGARNDLKKLLSPLDNAINNMAENKIV